MAAAAGEQGGLGFLSKRNVEWHATVRSTSPLCSNQVFSCPRTHSTCSTWPRWWARQTETRPHEMPRLTSDVRASSSRRPSAAEAAAAMPEPSSSSPSGSARRTVEGKPFAVSMEAASGPSSAAEPLPEVWGEQFSGGRGR